MGFGLFWFCLGFILKLELARELACYSTVMSFPLIQNHSWVLPPDSEQSIFQYLFNADDINGQKNSYDNITFLTEI